MKSFLLILHKVIGPLIGIVIGTVFMIIAAAPGKAQTTSYVFAGGTLIIFSILGLLVIFKVIKGTIPTVVGIVVSLVISVILAVANINSVKGELKYIELVDSRYNSVKEHLIKIREAELAFKTTYGRYTKDWDELISFIKDGKFPIPFPVGEVDDTNAVKQGIAYWDTNWVPVIGNGYFVTFPVDSLRFIPYNLENKEFFLDAGDLYIDPNNPDVSTPVFEASAQYRDFLTDLWKKYGRVSMDSSIVVGSMMEATTNGNWIE